MMSECPVFNYISDDPQAYLLLLKDFVRPSPDICTHCKARCLESFIKTASAPGLAWNRLSPDGRLRPAHTRLDAQLSALGITASNAFGLDLSEEEVDLIFQPAARRLTIDRDWDDFVHAVVAMTAYRGRARPDRYDAFKSQHGTDHYALGKKMELMCWSQFTSYDLVRPKGGTIEFWLFNLGQLLSGGAGVFLRSSSAFPCTSTTTDETETMKTEKKETEKDCCTCPIFTPLSGRHPDTFTGFEWINFVLSVAHNRISPDLLSAWSASNHPLFTEDLSTAYNHHPLSPGYDCTKDKSWYQPSYGYSRMRRFIVPEGIYNTDPRDVELSFLLGFDVLTDFHPLLDSPPPVVVEKSKFSSADLSEMENLRESFLAMFQNHFVCPWWFVPHRQTLATLSRQKLAHHIRGSMLTTFMALHKNLKLNRPLEGRHNEGGVDWVTASAFHFVPSPSGEPYPMKKVFEAAVTELRKRVREVWQVPLDENKAEGVKPFREGSPRRGSRLSSWFWGGYFDKLPGDRNEDEGEVSGPYGEWEDWEDYCLSWEPEKFMRRTFELE